MFSQQRLRDNFFQHFYTNSKSLIFQFSTLGDQNQSKQRPTVKDSDFILAAPFGTYKPPAPRATLELLALVYLRPQVG